MSDSYGPVEPNLYPSLSGSRQAPYFIPRGFLSSFLPATISFPLRETTLQTSGWYQHGRHFDFCALLSSVDRGKPDSAGQAFMPMNWITHQTGLPWACLASSDITCALMQLVLTNCHPAPGTWQSLLSGWHVWLLGGEFLHFCFLQPMLSGRRGRRGTRKGEKEQERKRRPENVTTAIKWACSWLLG